MIEEYLAHHFEKDPNDNFGIEGHQLKNFDQGIDNVKKSAKTIVSTQINRVLTESIINAIIALIQGFTKGGIMKTLKHSENSISRNQIQHAMNRFLSKGGQVKILPPQQIETKSMIGGGNWGPYESLEDILVV